METVFTCTFKDWAAACKLVPASWTYNTVQKQKRCWIYRKLSVRGNYPIATKYYPKNNISHSNASLTKTLSVLFVHLLGKVFLPQDPNIKAKLSKREHFGFDSLTAPITVQISTPQGRELRPTHHHAIISEWVLHKYAHCTHLHPRKNRKRSPA